VATPQPDSTPSAVADLERGLADRDARIATLENKLAVSDEARRWYEKAWHDEQAARRAIEQELRQTHAALAQALADRAALQRDHDRQSLDLRDTCRDLRERDADLARVQWQSDRKGDRIRDMARAARVSEAERREEDEALDELCRYLGIDDEDEE